MSQFDEYDDLRADLGPPPDEWEPRII
ncbi:MAG: hypothetical protein H6Q10_3157, partial [Acidobacteria bacterium]|nr:hypothetical protein [Acidobacteriota bacterium]